jgi:pyruvate formate lyase activating enzyme
MRVFAKGWSNGFDGPGRRLVFYLKGCNFRCLWCASPESISPEPEMLFYPERSQSAAACCDKGAVEGTQLNRELCRGCETRGCIEVWRNRAFERVGIDMSQSEMLQEVTQRLDMLGPDGGVTFSGGEATLQMDELLDVARELKSLGVNLALETNASSPRFERLFEAFDLLICDVKCITPSLHRQIAGADNKLVLANVAAAAKAGVNLIIRVPLVAELNFTAAEQRRFLEFFREIRPAKVEFLRLHHLGLPKYEALGQDYPARKLTAPTRSAVDEFCRALSAYGVQATLVQ